MAPDDGCPTCGQKVCSKLACARPAPLTFEHMQECVKRFEKNSLEAAPLGSLANPFIVSPADHARLIALGWRDAATERARVGRGRRRRR